MTIIANPWTPYGLQHDPFFQDPLSPDQTVADPPGLFVGRGEEMQLLGGQVVGSVSSRAIVQGGPGVGKTTFVNRLKAALAAEGVLTHELPIKMEAEMTARRFCAEALRVLLQIRASQRTPAAGSRKQVTDHLKTPAARQEGAFWKRVGRLIEGEDTRAGGIAVGGVGGQYAIGRIPAEVTNLSLCDELAQATRYLTGVGASRGHQRDGRVLLHVNNLENLSRADMERAAGLIQELRDYFLIAGSHWVFVGTSDIEHAIFRATPQVSGIVPLAVTLEPLSADNIARMLTLRYLFLQRGVRRATPPIDPDDARGLYGRYRGDLRNFLRLLSLATQRHAAVSPGVPLSRTQVLALMEPEYFAQLVRHIGEHDAVALKRVVAGADPDVEIRVLDVQRTLEMTQAGASSFIARLTRSRVLTRTRTAGRNVYYRTARGDDTIALGLK